MANTKEVGMRKKKEKKHPERKSKKPEMHPGSKYFFSLGFSPGARNCPMKNNKKGIESPNPPSKQTCKITVNIEKGALVIKPCRSGLSGFRVISMALSRGHVSKSANFPKKAITNRAAIMKAMKDFKSVHRRSSR